MCKSCTVYITMSRRPSPHPTARVANWPLPAVGTLSRCNKVTNVNYDTSNTIQPITPESHLFLKDTWTKTSHTSWTTPIPHHQDHTNFKMSCPPDHTCYNIRHQPEKKHQLTFCTTQPTHTTHISNIIHHPQQTYSCHPDYNYSLTLQTIGTTPLPKSWHPTPPRPHPSAGTRRLNLTPSQNIVDLHVVHSTF